ncbi:kinase-like domain, phloem protein 2-like protein [Tanacetum coccineum]
MSSPNYDHLAHLKIPLENIISATNNFDEENIIYKSGFEKRYRGQLLWSSELIEIRAQRWLNKEMDDEKEQQCRMEISLLFTIKHKNLVSLVGFCDENDEKIIIIGRETRGSLDHYQVIASERHLSFDASNVSNKLGYTDPTYLETKSAHHKSDIYSLGIVMFELVCGRKAVIDNEDNKYLAPTAIFHYREEKLEDIVEWNLWKQMDLHSFKVFTDIAYDCLKEERSQRPNIKEIVPKLQKALELARVNKPVTL